MTKRSHDEPEDKAKERLRQFELAREPQVSEEVLFEGLDELIDELRANGEPLTDRAAERLEQFRDTYYLQRGFRQHDAPGGNEGGSP